MPALDPLEVALAAARRAGALLLSASPTARPTTSKTHRHDRVTAHDRLAEEAIVTHILAAFPDDGILSEEGTHLDGRSPCRWVIDPIDGTSNFARGIPAFSVSIARLCNGRPQVACVFDPIRNEAFTAASGQPARSNDRPISVSDQASLDGAVIAVGFSVLPDRRARTLAGLLRLLEPAEAIRTSGSAALDLAYLAAGRVDAVWYVSLHEWDVAAGRLLIRAAGGVITSPTGAPLDDPNRGVLATNGRIHREFVRALAEPDER